MSKKFDIIAIGSALKDIFIMTKDIKCANGRFCHPFNPENTGSKINVKNMFFDTGGGGANTAATFANFGLKTALFSCLGHDIAGKEIIIDLKKRHINTEFLQIKNDQETGYSVIFISPSGERTALTYRGASEFKFLTFPASKISADWLYLSSVNGNLKLISDIYHYTRSKKNKIAWNPGNAELMLGIKKIKSFLIQTNIIILNLSEANLLTNLKTNNVQKLFTKLRLLAPLADFCLTAGDQGAWLLQKNTTYYAKPAKIKIVNTTGAGDAFGSGLVAGLLIYQDASRAMQIAMLNAQGVIQKMGAKHGLLKNPPSDKMLKTIKIERLSNLQK